MFQLSNNPGRTTICNNEEHLFFSGYAYLGVQHHEQFKELFQEGLNKYGWLFPSSRISNTALAIYDEFEALLTSLTHTAQTISFSSGYSAGTLASGLFKNHPTSICPIAHPAINKLQQEPCTFDQWAESTLNSMHQKQFTKTPVLIADSVNPLNGEVNDFDFLRFIDKPVIVIIDDSHGIGLLGEMGEGISSMLPQKSNIEYVLTYSLSKAFSINGGAISCSSISTAQLIESLPEFTASTAIAPALAFAFIKGQAIYLEQRKQLQKNILFARGLLAENELILNDDHLPVFILPEHLDEEYFANKKMIVSSFAYPNPQGKKINRVVVNALHTENDLLTLSKAILQQ
ncbi:MAG: aminotransferase class I/II-fold pyridoxal phosphate-dependent enzyme [Chitinophagaceae bacterium]|nr:aminotransferase class I/II-fold pyridoxal phosphate-dependent enzyme [Chitinophagaceae bacterium]